MSRAKSKAKSKATKSKKSKAAKPKKSKAAKAVKAAKPKKSKAAKAVKAAKPKKSKAKKAVAATEETILLVKNVHKRFNEGAPTEVHALRGASCKIQKGEIVAIMGPSGSGKTTLLNLIGGLDRISEGTVVIGDTDVGTMSEEERTDFRLNNLGFIFQTFNLLDYLSAIQNVMLPLLGQGMPKEEARRKSMMLLRELGMGGKADHYPTELSGGQAQKVAIARSLIARPQLMLGDEPTGDLDMKSSEDIMRVFRSINRERGVTMVLVTHSIWIGDMCDRIIHIDDGRIVGNGKTKQEDDDNE